MQRSIKITSVKPSGSVSLLAGATPGVHWEHAPYYIRRARTPDNRPLVEMCAKAGYPIEPDRYSGGTSVVSFPIHVQHCGRRKTDVALSEKVDLAAQMQRYWSDNQVSCTADFGLDREKEKISRILEAYEDRLKGIVFLPAGRHGYEQPPYEEITSQEFERLRAILSRWMARYSMSMNWRHAFARAACVNSPKAFEALVWNAVHF